MAIVNKAWARASPALAELLRNAWFRLPCSSVAKDVMDFQLPEGAEELAGKGAHTSYKRKGVKERQESLFLQLLKEIEEKRAARSIGNEWGGEARYGVAFRNELAKQACPLIGGTEEEKKVFFDRAIGAHPECFYIKGCDPPTISDKLIHFRLKPGAKPVARQPTPCRHTISCGLSSILKYSCTKEKFGRSTPTRSLFPCGRLRSLLLTRTARV